MRLPLFALVGLAACSSAPSGPVTESGSLEVGDMTLQSGEYYDEFSVSAAEGQWIEVEVSAEGFDPYLIVRSPSGSQSDMDDSEAGNTTSTRSVLRADEGGSWDIIVTSYAPGGTGTYSVTYSVADAMPPGADAPGPDADSTVTA